MGLIIPLCAIWKLKLCQEPINLTLSITGPVWSIREGTFFLGGGGLGPQRGGSSVKVSTKRGGPYLL